MSKLYSLVQLIDAKDDNLYCQCLKSRYKLLKSVPTTNLDLCYELSNITSPMFDKKYEKLKAAKTKPSKQQIQQLNEYGKKCLAVTIRILKEC